MGATHPALFSSIWSPGEYDGRYLVLLQHRCYLATACRRGEFPASGRLQARHAACHETGSDLREPCVRKGGAKH